MHDLTDDINIETTKNPDKDTFTLNLYCVSLYSILLTLYVVFFILCVTGLFAPYLPRYFSAFIVPVFAWQWYLLHTMNTKVTALYDKKKDLVCLTKN